MDNRKVLIGSVITLGVGIFGYAIYKYFKKQTELLKDFAWQIASFRFTSVDLNLLKGVMSINFTNKSDVEIKITEAYMDFYFDGVNIGYFQDVQEFVIPAHDTTNIPFEFTLNPQIVIGNFTNLILYTTRQKDAAITVKGFVKVKSGFIKGTFPITYDTTLKQLLAG
jgi:LEA14-like dessication related protein